MTTLVLTNRESPEPTIEYASFEYTLVSADSFTFTHGFVNTPKVSEVFLKCLTAELGYAIGDQVEINASASMSVTINKIECKVALVTLPSIVNYSTHTATAVTAANWNIVIKLEQ
jgi:hypothetical protein